MDSRSCFWFFAGGAKSPPRPNSLQVVLLALVLWGGFCVRNGRGQDWEAFRGENGQGIWERATTLADFQTAPPELVWSEPIGPGYSGIAISQGKLVTMERAGEAERVVCRSLETGKLIWEQSYPADYTGLDYDKGPRCTPTIHRGQVFTFGAVGHLCAFSLESGKVLWKRDLKTELGAKQPTWGFSASPLVYQDKLIIHAGLEPNGCYACFQQSDGKEVWRCGSDPAGYGIPRLIERGKRKLLVGWTPEHITGIDPESGAILWEIPYKVTYGVSITSPLIHGDLICVCGYWEGSKCIRMSENGESAELVWEENKWLRGLMADPMARGEHAYLLDKQHGVICFRVADGEKVWSDDNKLTPRDRNPHASIVWVGDSSQVIALNATGELVLAKFEPTGYTEVSRFKILGETWAHPAYANDFLVARDDERIVCYRLSPSKH